MYYLRQSSNFGFHLQKLNSYLLYLLCLKNLLVFFISHIVRLFLVNAYMDFLSTF